MRIKITESQLRLIEKYIPFKHQEKVDYALDKINKSGIESLSDDEMFFLKNPDADIENVELDMSEFEDESASMMGMLTHFNLIDVGEYQQIDDMLFQVRNINTNLGITLDYFKEGNYLYLTCKPMDAEILIEFEPQADEQSISEVQDYIRNSWTEVEEYIDIHFL